MENNKEGDYIPNQVISKENLKKYFENGDIPDEQDFWEWQDSYWHKNDSNDIIPAERVDLSGKSDKNATNLDGENVQNWRTKLNIENTDQDNIAVVHNFTLADLGATGKEGEEALNQLIINFINSLNITIGERELHYFQLLDGDNFGDTTSTFISLEGTQEGRPVTGNIESNASLIIKGSTNGTSETGGIGIGSNDDAILSLSNSNDGILNINFNNVGLDASLTNLYIRGDKSGVLLVDSDISYSTEENKTGATWVDGKPIYRRVFDGFIPFNEAYYMDPNPISLLNNINPVTIMGFVRNSSEGKIPVNTVWENKTINSSIGYNGYSSNLFFKILDPVNNGSNIPYSIILEYTKTTD